MDSSLPSVAAGCGVASHCPSSDLAALRDCSSSSSSTRLRRYRTYTAESASVACRASMSAYAVASSA